MIWGVEDATVLGLVGIVAGLLTAALSFWWNYKTRSLPHREFLYQKQIEAYLELLSEVSTLLRPCYQYLLEKGTATLTPENKSEYQKIAQDAWFGVIDQRRRGFVILPRDVVEAITALMRVLAESVSHPERLPDSPFGIEKPLVTSEFNIYNAIRKNAGIDPLTEELREVFGQTKPKPSSAKSVD